MAGPEVALLIAEFEAGITSGKVLILKHHDQSPCVQNGFTADTKALVATFQEDVYPFDEDMKSSL